MERHRFGDGGKYSRMPSRWPSDTQPNQHPRYSRGGGIAGGGEGFGGRYHPYRGQPDYSSAGGQGFRDGHGDLGGHQMPMGGQKRGFAGRGGSPDFGEGNKFAKLFIGSIPKTATEEDIRPLFEEHGDVVEVALIKDWRTGHQQGFGFIKYASSEHADRAIRALNNRYTLPGATVPIQVKYADGERDRFGTAEDKLFVASLNRRATEKEVEEIFALYGHVEDVYLMKDEMKQSRGCGFVKFSNRDMALAAMNALHGTYVMRGCDQPLIVRFAEPKRPRPIDQRNAPAFGGPGFGPQSDAVILNRQPENFDEAHGGHIPHKRWTPRSPQSGGLPTQSSTQGFGSQTTVMGGIAPTLAVGSGSFGDAVPSTNGALPNVAPISSSSQSFNPPIAQAPPAMGQHMLPLQKSLPLPQNLPPALPVHNALLSFSHAQTQALQAPMQQLGQFQLPQSIGFNSFSQAQQVPGLSAQLSASPSLTPQNATAATLLNSNQQLGQQQGLPAVPNQQQLPFSNISQQLLQQPGHQLPTQMLLQQQAQTLQSSYQSSQQAIFQIQQQLQMMQHSNLNQQQSSQSAKQQSPWSGPPATSTTPSMLGAAIPSTISANPSHALSVPSGAAASTCNWTEHTSPEGFKYYYNSVTRESKWEKPEELTVFEQQQQQQQKLLLLQQQQLLLQQQKIAAPQLKSPSHAPSQMQVQTIQQMASTQVQPQMQPRQQAQLQILQPSLAYQAPGAAGHPSVQDLSNPQLHGAGSVIDSTKMPKML